MSPDIPFLLCLKPDFAALAKAYGGFCEIVTSDAEFPDALARARASRLPAILHLKLNPAALSPRMILEDVD